MVGAGARGPAAPDRCSATTRALRRPAVTSRRPVPTLVAGVAITAILTVLPGLAAARAPRTGDYPVTKRSGRSLLPLPDGGALSDEPGFIWRAGKATDPFYVDRRCCASTRREGHRITRTVSCGPQPTGNARDLVPVRFGSRPCRTASATPWRLNTQGGRQPRHRGLAQARCRRSGLSPALGPTVEPAEGWHGRSPAERHPLGPRLSRTSTTRNHARGVRSTRAR